MSGAVFSECMRYRYALWRRWEATASGVENMVSFVGLNPSTADESDDDPTIRRCIRFARGWGFNGLFMLNAYAFRATKPEDMKRQLDPIGPRNNSTLSEYAAKSNLVVACWGAHCTDARQIQVCGAIGKIVHCLGLTKNGRPRHPLYLRADSEPITYQPTPKL